MIENQPTAIIFGAGGRVARALDALLERAGWNRVLAARDRTALGQSEAPGALRCHCDVTQSDQVQQVFDTALERVDRIDAVANCAGSLLLKPGHLVSDEDWHQVVATNLSAAFYVVRAATRAMLKTGGSIALVSTAAARTGFANHEAIAAAKSGVEGLVRAAAATYANKGIRVNAVAPGLVESQMTASLTENQSMREASAAMHALGRIGQPQEVARALAWLLDPDQSWVTGQILGVDGGLAHIRPRTPARASARRSSPAAAGR